MATKQADLALGDFPSIRESRFADEKGLRKERQNAKG
jgi:hypothetical protein